MGKIRAYPIDYIVKKKDIKWAMCRKNLE